jgi:DNA (cytosine-5)-methyltransferase 1
MKKQSYLTVTDQFCGAGGSSQGVRNANQRIKGIEVKLALNHWKLAIETHNTNFPETIHDCTDISASDPRRYPSTNILITSPECTNHSLAKGEKAIKSQLKLFEQGKLDPAAERSRATMWDVCRFAEYHKYEAIIVENVVDARSWIMWEAWLKAMHLLGYAHECVYRNSQHFQPTPQSRDRLYIVFWKKGNKKPDLNLKPKAFCPSCGKDVLAVQTFKDLRKPFGKYRTQYYYRCPVHGTQVEPYYYAAFNCIDWSKPGTRISERDKPLSENTIRRINSGLNKYANHPFIINNQHSTGIDFRVKSTLEPINTISTAHGFRLVTPPPFIIKLEHSKQEGYVRSAMESMQTQTTTQSMGVVTPPFLVELKGTSNHRSVDAPLGCVTSVGYHGIVSNDAFRSFLTYYYSGYDQNSAITDPTATIPTKERAGLVTFQKPVLEDCFYRMISSEEVKLAMAFDKNYVVLGTEKDKVKQCGNAVTPPAMEWLVERVAESLDAA